MISVAMSLRPIILSDVAYQSAGERGNIAPNDKKGMIGETEPHVSSPSRKKWMLLAIYCVAQVRGSPSEDPLLMGAST
jgi:hypothetical protein